MTREKQKTKKITKEMSISQIIEIKPDAIEVLLEFGLGCVGCAFSEVESLEQGAMGHGMDQEMVNKIIEEINKLE